MRTIGLMLLSVITLIFVDNVIASQAFESAQNCKTLLCVRNNIDRIDQHIVKLIGERLAYVKRAGELKKNKKAIHDPAREKQILIMVNQQAKHAGYPGSIAQEIFKIILQQSNIYEKQYHENY